MKFNQDIFNVIVSMEDRITALEWHTGGRPQPTFAQLEEIGKQLEADGMTAEEFIKDQFDRYMEEKCAK